MGTGYQSGQTMTCYICWYYTFMDILKNDKGC